MFRPSLTETILLALLALSVAFGGWNWWRKGVYYDALQLSAQLSAQRARAITDELQAEANQTARELGERHAERERELEGQLQYLRDHPVVRTEYVVREKWRQGACAAGAAGSAAGVQAGGFPLELEQYLVRAAAAADAIVDERNACVEMYDRARAAALKHNVGR